MVASCGYEAPWYWLVVPIAHVPRDRWLGTSNVVGGKPGSQCLRLVVCRILYWLCSRKTHCLLLWCLQVNYDALLDLMCLVVDQQLAQGPKAFLGDWSEATPYLNKLKGSQAAHGGAVLVFLPGAPEISRAQRALLGSERLAAAAGGRQNLRVLPLHGSLSSEDQKRVFSR